MQQQVKSSTKQRSLFDVVQNQKTSQLYMKKMLVVGVSTITYLRGFFDEAAYAERKVADIPVRILRSMNTNKEAEWIMKMIKGSFDAIEKQYLRELVLGIYKDPNDKENSFVDAFSFLFEYGNGTEMTVSYRLGEQPKRLVNRLLSSEDLEQMSKDLFRKLMTFCTSLDRFDAQEKKYLTMKLYYYDHTPRDYNPPGFRHAEQYECRFLEDRKPVSHSLGSVATRWHALDLKAKSVMLPTENVPEAETSLTPTQLFTGPESPPSPVQLMSPVQSTPQRVTPTPERIARVRAESVLVTPADGIPRVSARVQAQSVDVFEGGEAGAKETVRVAGFGGEKKEVVAMELARNVGSLNIEEPSSTTVPLSQEIGSEVLPSQEDTAIIETDRESIVTIPVSEHIDTSMTHEGTKLNCPCGANTYLLDLMIQCDECKTYQHPVCFSVLEEKDLENGHVCADCSEKTGFYTDTTFVGKPKDKLQVFCFTRLLLSRMLTEEITIVDTQDLLDLYQVPRHVLMEVLQFLESVRVLRKQRKRGAAGKYNVNREKLSEQVDLFLNRRLGASQVHSSPIAANEEVVEDDPPLSFNGGESRKRKSDEEAFRGGKKMCSVPESQKVAVY